LERNDRTSARTRSDFAESWNFERRDGRVYTLYGRAKMQRRQIVHNIRYYDVTEKIETATKMVRNMLGPWKKSNYKSDEVWKIVVSINTSRPILYSRIYFNNVQTNSINFASLTFNLAFGRAAGCLSATS
jgi:hypothetical protein